jgi:hypothetical protein
MGLLPSPSSGEHGGYQDLNRTGYPSRNSLSLLSSSAVQMFGYPELDHPPASSAMTAPPPDGSEGYLAPK